jgi:hypothetical protein
VAARTLRLDRDLRDVVVDGTRLRVSRFRSAELLTVEADGTVSGRLTPPAFTAANARANQVFTASVAWRTMALPDGGVMMLHQRGVVDPIMPSPGGYGSTDPCTSIVHPTVTTVAADGSVRAGAAVAGLVMAVDAAVSADGSHIAFVSMGNATNTQLQNSAATPTARVFVTDINGDGNEDISMTGVNKLFLNDGKANFTPMDFITESVFRGSTDAGVVADFNGDGKLDFVTVAKQGGLTNKVVLYAGNGSVPFTVEPMVARQMMPILGGVPMVWNGCVVFFQAVLLAGYGGAHVMTQRLAAP